MWAAAVRRFATSAIRRGHYEDGPGKNLPFSVENKWRLLAVFAIACGTISTLTVVTARNLALRTA
ncbi:cytochrome c oxidase subunit 7C, mitochondrial [Pogona vitticeps]|uniref:Cytochrome c oxidase subunit 7C, mitochondrial n=1 Tax=Pogona vitticeps TaxID=103695 RepID=A0A6J0SSU0_9SAUR|nr:cytochrome c oxidase subunit 7C, mitochondrial [Pogona vitticeps]